MYQDIYGNIDLSDINNSYMNSYYNNNYQNMIDIESINNIETNLLDINDEFNTNNNLDNNLDDNLNYSINNSLNKTNTGYNLSFYIVLILLIINIILLSTMILKKRNISFKLHILKLLYKFYFQITFAILIILLSYLLCRNSKLYNASWILLIIPLCSLFSICCSLIGNN